MILWSNFIYKFFNYINFKYKLRILNFAKIIILSEKYMDWYSKSTSLIKVAQIYDFIKLKKKKAKNVPKLFY